MREKKFEKLKEKVQQLDVLDFTELFEFYVKKGRYNHDTKYCEHDFITYLAAQVLYNKKNIPYFSIQNLIIKMINNEIKDKFKLITFNFATDAEYDFIKKWCWENQYIYTANIEAGYLDIEVVKVKEEEEKC